ncbi:MAG: UDP-N-acetylglucosamine 2-epimerase (non-hydrolyzing) [Candidatus Cloacimonetes bacterium]|nr:UDP-N-acetylglucosamine 2-epimerase (non-hydrolyzing) [Candidatus Cloacimonadota bacterium]MCF7813208.1 UDP-N-acetylglucosamine 2-epimerase (non-hydrolyzing) [Candidatus Cloacimonadota bacterium]MCF7867407.1 UDP-N-acetylglucosamine 2-epimerase (non-hydrolyzing) [Candidatus Cloacimonadota bacterium]MCF7882961.1 UDP-N-acetylglucosamine 2-epimerase (non-hydrolyzing) [Candidatus Cloacimonadota bacterium]
MKKQKIHLIVGARPNFMKMAPLYKEFAKFPEEFELKLIHTGQHYDERMSKFFFDDLQMPKPDEYLEVGSGTHGQQTARIMERYEKVLLKEKPDLVIVAGDVNSTSACAIDAVKLHIPVAHLEAGLRSFARTMPEEINRILTDAISDYLLTPSTDGDENLLNEGVPKEKIHFVGNIMIDSLIQYKDKAKQSDILKKIAIKEKEYALITLHRPSNVDSEKGLLTILNAFEEISKSIKLVFPIHPRTRKQISEFDLEEKVEKMTNLILTDPVGYYDFLKLQMEAKFILTDSGGIQEESTYFGVPCLTLRPNTERPITIWEGTNKLVKLETDDIIKEAKEILNGNIKNGKIPKYWDGKTAERIVKIFRK